MRVTDQLAIRADDLSWCLARPSAGRTEREICAAPSDRGEPPHIHVQRERYVAKLWLEPVALVTNRGFRAHEIRRITRLVVQYQAILLEAWHDYFGT